MEKVIKNKRGLELVTSPSSGYKTSSTSICPFESGKSGKEDKKIQKFEYLKNEKSFLDVIKNIFHSF